MAQMVRDVMTKDPVSMSSDASVAEAAKAMSDLRIGSVVVMDKDRPCGIVTDRDITVRAVATGRDPVEDPARRHLHSRHRRGGAGSIDR